MGSKVNFNQQLASAAVTSLQTLQARLKAYTSAERPLRVKAQKNWTGPYATDYAGKAQSFDAQAADLVTMIGSTISALQTGADAAKTQNAKSGS